VDGIVVADERGMPLADVLRAQAQDVHEEDRRLKQEGGKKEIAMMIPTKQFVPRGRRVRADHHVPHCRGCP
jgi:tight adherence protein C